ncbi:conserved hypothetical protein, partial [Trichinella spiralis]|uniref:hypothetical protein n=1 Tax=Trichinella spiralis TaxID=6334 RepID=UPI0001EFD686
SAQKFRRNQNTTDQINFIVRQSGHVTFFQKALQKAGRCGRMSAGNFRQQPKCSHSCRAEATVEWTFCKRRTDHCWSVWVRPKYRTRPTGDRVVGIWPQAGRSNRSGFCPTMPCRWTCASGNDPPELIGTKFGPGRENDAPSALRNSRPSGRRTVPIWRPTRRISFPSLGRASKR